jgi:two-component system sensor histidine kinase SenX3
MHPLAVAILVIGGSLFIGMAFVVGWRLASRVRTLEGEVQRSTDAMRREELSSEDGRRVQDLILNSMHDGILLFDGGHRTAFANAALERHLGTCPEATNQLYPPSLRDMVKRVTGSHEVSTLDFGRDEPTRWLRATATAAGSDGSILLVVTDITETRRIEAVRRDFVANASHELKTPAASIQAAAETLVSVADRDPAAVPRFAAQLEREAMRLSRIVADLLDLSRLESGSELGERVRLDALVREEVERFEERAREAGVVIDTSVSGPASVSGSARDLSLLARNLIDNAIRYTAPEGRISIRVQPNGEWVALVVEDNGMGIPSRDLPRIFERFYRVDRARSRETGGTGLGLAIVKHVAENHGGSVDVVSELGAGSTFTVTLPEAIPTT